MTLTTFLVGANLLSARKTALFVFVVAIIGAETIATDGVWDETVAERRRVLSYLASRHAEKKAKVIFVIAFVVLTVAAVITFLWTDQWTWAENDLIPCKQITACAVLGALFRSGWRNDGVRTCTWQRVQPPPPDTHIGVANHPDDESGIARLFVIHKT